MFDATKTFSVGFKQENFDESDLAKELSDILENRKCKKNNHSR